MRLLSCLLFAGALCVTAQEPVDYKGWLNQGVQAFKSAHYAEAVAAFERAVALDPATPTARLYLGTAYMQQYIPGAESAENLLVARRAEEQFRGVLAIDAQNKTALASIASLTLNQKKFDDALGWYAKLIAIDPNNADAYYTLGFVAWSKWYPEYAKARKDAGMRPEDPGPLADPAVRHALDAQYGPMLQAGIDALAKALELRPDYADAMAYTNLLIRERADLRDSVAEYRQEVATADQWVQKALAAKKAQAEGRRTAPPTPPTRIRVGENAMQSKVVSRVAPSATTFRGTVVLSVVIGNDGSVKEVSVKQGHPMLLQPAMDAVKQWKYRPTLLNGAPVAVETEVTLTF